MQMTHLTPETNIRPNNLNNFLKIENESHGEHGGVHFLTNVLVAQIGAVVGCLDQQIEECQSFLCSDPIITGFIFNFIVEPRHKHNS
jgi:hypothetical protein